MKLQHITFGTQLRLASGGVLTLVAGFGGFAWSQADGLWSQTRLIYDHPLAGKGMYENSGN